MKDDEDDGSNWDDDDDTPPPEEDETTDQQEDEPPPPPKPKKKYGDNLRKPNHIFPHSKGALDLEWYARFLMRKFGPFISIGSAHWRWNGSVWQPIDFDRYRADAVLIQPAKARSVTAVDNILRMMNNLTQVNPDFMTELRCIRFAEVDDGKVLINCENGVVQVDPQEINSLLIKHKPDDFVTTQLPIFYDPAAKCPTFDYILESTLPNEEDRYMLKCFVGYCLLPDHRFQCVLFCHGAPNSGKSLLMYHGVRTMFGSKLISNVSLEKICNGGDELRELESSLVNIGTEIDSRGLKNFAVFNQIACAEEISAALKYEKSRRILPWSKHIFIGNHLPKWERGSDAQARRIKILHFSEDFSKESRDGQLERNVQLETAGIFNWALQGLAEVMGLKEMPVGSKSSRSFGKQFRKHNNPLETFNKKFCEFDPTGRISTSDYSTTFRNWCQKEGIAFNANATKLLLQGNPLLHIKPTHIGNQSVRAIFGIKFNEKGVALLQNIDDSE